MARGLATAALAWLAATGAAANGRVVLDYTLVGEFSELPVVDVERVRRLLEEHAEAILLRAGRVFH